MRKRLVAFLLIVVLAFSVTSNAYAQANPSGPCTAILASAFGPGSGIADEVHQVQAIAQALGVPFGQLAKALAGTHGTLEECIAYIPTP